jgi:hypothetical protein
MKLPRKHFDNDERPSRPLERKTLLEPICIVIVFAIGGFAGMAAKDLNHVSQCSATNSLTIDTVTFHCFGDARLKEYQINSKAIPSENHFHEFDTPHDEIDHLLDQLKRDGDEEALREYLRKRNADGQYI